MKVVVKTEGVDFAMPVPLAMADMAIKAMPDSVFERMQAKIGEPYGSLFTRDIIKLMFSECKDIFRKNKSLEIIHAEGSDGTYVSVTL